MRKYLLIVVGGLLLSLGYVTFSYTQAQGYGPPEVENPQKYKKTEIRLKGYEVGKELKLNITNVGDRKLNTSNFEL